MNSLARPDFKKILVISLSNIGDVILTLPVADILRNDFPAAELSLMVGPKAASLVKGNPNFKEVYIYDKHQSSLETLRLVLRLRRERFDLVVDLRNSAFPILINPRRRTSIKMTRLPGRPMRWQHLERLRSVYDFPVLSPQRYSVEVTPRQVAEVSAALNNGQPQSGAMVVVAPGAADERKRWSEKGFARLCDLLVKLYQARIVFVGDQSDRAAVGRIRSGMAAESLDLSGQMDLLTLAGVIQQAGLVISNDSAPMHLASYLDVPVLALFGYTDPLVYGPWSGRSLVIEKKAQCPACRGEEDAGEHICLTSLDVIDVINAIEWKNGVLVLKAAPGRSAIRH